MKNKPLILGTLAVTMLVATGCDKPQPTDESPANGDTNTLSESAHEAATNAWQKTKEVTTNVVASVKDSMQAATDYAYDKKEDFIAGASAGTEALDEKIQAFSDKAAKVSDSVKAQAQATLQDLKAKRVELGKKLDDVKNATAENWNDVKSGFQSSYDDLKNSLKQAW